MRRQIQSSKEKQQEENHPIDKTIRQKLKGANEYQQHLIDLFQEIALRSSKTATCSTTFLTSEKLMGIEFDVSQFGDSMFHDHRVRFIFDSQMEIQCKKRHEPTNAEFWETLAGNYLGTVKVNMVLIQNMKIIDLPVERQVELLRPLALLLTDLWNDDTIGHHSKRGLTAAFWHWDIMFEARLFF